MLFATFTDTGSSQAFTALRGGFDLVLTPMTGTNSLTIEREVTAGTWIAFTSAITAAGTTTYAHGIDYTAPVRFRVTCGTHDTEDILVYLHGDILADEFSSVSAGLGLMLETTDPEDLLMEDGDYLLLEAA